MVAEVRHLATEALTHLIYRITAILPRHLKPVTNFTNSRICPTLRCDRCNLCWVTEVDQCLADRIRACKCGGQ